MNAFSRLWLSFCYVSHTNETLDYFGGIGLGLSSMFVKQTQIFSFLRAQVGQDLFLEHV